jgi:hypothetical protein
MLLCTEALLGYKIRANNDDIGKVSDFYFCAQKWVICYIVFDLFKGMGGRHVLMSPSEVKHPNLEDQNTILHSNLSKIQIEKSSEVRAFHPEHSQQGTGLLPHYGWIPISKQVQEIPCDLKSKTCIKNSSHAADQNQSLWSLKQIEGYSGLSSNGAIIGYLEDFIIDTELWALSDMVIRTQKEMLSGKRVLVSFAWIARINKKHKRILLEMTPQGLRGLPEYDPTAPVNRGDESKFYDFYGRPNVLI